jgi:hypothetical protein
MSIAGKSTSAATGRAARTAWRFASGHHMDGQHRTDATWTRRGTRPLVAGGRVSPWSMLSRSERAALRLTITTGAGAALWGSQTHPAGTEQSLTAAGGAVALAAGYGSAQWLGHWRHRREWVRPLHLALEGPLGLPAGTRPASYLHIPKDYPTRTDVGRIDLPAAFTGDSGTSTSTVSAIIKTKLGLTDVSVSYKLAGRKPHLLLTQAQRPRAKAMFGEQAVRALVEAAPESAPLIGLGPQDRVVSLDLDSESPHVLVSMSTGGGKSVVTRTMTAQMLNRGSNLVVLDFKRHSHKWAKGLPNVDYARDIADIHDALVRLGVEGNRRNILVDDWEGDEKDCPVGTRVAIILEEANATISKLKRYWAGAREKEDPKESPAIDALREILFMGRAVKMHVLLVAQSATANALGGPEVRECFSARVLARYSRNAWMMLCPEVQPVPRSSRHVGRAQVVLGGIASETQVAFFSPDQARQWATAGTVAPPLELWGPRAAPTLVPMSQDDPDSVYQGEQPGTVPGQRRLYAVPAKPAAAPTVHLDKQADAPIGLAEAVKEGILTVTLDSARAARKRDSEFPAHVTIRGQEKLYAPDSLRRWERNRPKNTEGVPSERTGTE